MPREIKFRAWDANVSRIMSLSHINCDDENGNRSQNENYVLMQFTGIKDRNGKEIYEGDIIKFKHFPFEETVEVARLEDGAYRPMVSDCCHCREENEYNEVIGNIYENPELLSNPTTI